MADKFVGMLEWEHYNRAGYGPRPVYKGGDRVMARLDQCSYSAVGWEVTAECRTMADGRPFVGVKVSGPGEVGLVAPVVLEWNNIEPERVVLPVLGHVVTVLEDLIEAYREVAFYAPSQHRGAEASGGALGAAELLLTSVAFLRAGNAARLRGQQ